MWPNDPVDQRTAAANYCLESSSLIIKLEECDELPHNPGSTWMKMVAIVLGILVTITGILGNILTLWALSAAIDLRKRVSTILIMNLSAADLSYCLLAMPFNIITTINPNFWCHYPRLCTYTAYFRYSCAFLDWTCLAMVALERYGKIVHWNTKFYEIISRRAFVMVAIFTVWTFHFGVMLLYLDDTRFGKFAYNPQVQRCDFFPKNGFKYARRVNFSVWSLPLLCVIGVCYVHIYVYAKKHSKDIMAFGDSSVYWNESIQRIQERDMRLARTLFILVCSYTFCVIPVAMANIFDNCDKYPDLQTAAYAVYFFMYAINNIIYAAYHPEYRQAYGDLISRCCPGWLAKRTLPIIAQGRTAANHCCDRNPHYRLTPHSNRRQRLCRKASSFALKKKNSDEFPLGVPCTPCAPPLNPPADLMCHQSTTSNKSKHHPRHRCLMSTTSIDIPAEKLMDHHQPRQHPLLRQSTSSLSTAMVSSCYGRKILASRAAIIACAGYEAGAGKTSTGKSPASSSAGFAKWAGNSNDSQASSSKTTATTDSSCSSSVNPPPTGIRDDRQRQAAGDGDSGNRQHVPIWRSVSSSMTIAGIEIETTSRIRLPPSIEPLASGWL